MRPTTRILACALLAGVGPFAQAQSHLFTIPGSTTYEWCGAAVSSAGDVNSDGHDDFLVGRPRDATNGMRAGRVTWVSGADGSVLRESYGDDALDEFGCALARIGDVDGDGIDDVAVGAWLGDDPSGVQCGEVKMLSGATGAVIRSLYGSGGDHFGIALAALGDVNGDLVPDLAVGADQADVNGVDSGGVFVFSGATGALLRSIGGSESGVHLGSAVAGAGDCDLDGVPDVIVATPWGGDSAAGYFGHVQLRSGADDHLLHEWFGTSALNRFGWSVAGPGDLDGDGRGDVLVGIRNAKPNGNASGAAHLYAGSDGSLIRDHLGLAAGNYFGTSVAGVGDVNSDGVADVLIGAPGADAARIHSGSDGVELGVLTGTPTGSAFGAAVTGAGDLDGDGVPDLLVGRHNGIDIGAAIAFSGTARSLSTDTHQVSAGAGGTQTFSLDAGAANAHRSYIVLGSVSGTHPGIPIFPVVLPLNYDPYLLYTAANPNTAPLSNSLGQLDGSGHASASFTLPAGFPQFAGIQLHHAFLLVGPVNFASNPVPLTLVP